MTRLEDEVYNLPYKLYVDKDRRTLVRVWPDGRVETATRVSREHTWGPPIKLARSEA